MRFLLLPLFIFLSLHVSAQCRTFKLSSKGDTLNCVDMKGLKQGKWFIQTPKLRGEAGFEEEGEYKNDRKEGTWRRYNLMGDLLAMENYKWGNKHGKSVYFTIEGIEHEESWRALNPNKLFDTLDVADLKDPNKYEKVIVKNDGTSLRHGTWKFYNPTTSSLLNQEEYFLDKLKTEEEAQSDKVNEPSLNTPKANNTVKKDSTVAKVKPKEVLEFEKKNAGKKKVKVLDGTIKQKQ